MARLIDSYVSTVSARLSVDERRRARILAEIADHLTESADAMRAAGRPAEEADRIAISAFGDPGAFASRFNAEFSTARSRRVAWLTGWSLVILLVLAVPLQIPGWRQPNTWPDAYPPAALYGLLDAFLLLVQIAAVAIGVSLVRVVHFRGLSAMPTRERRLVARGALIASVASLAAAAIRIGFEFERIRWVVTTGTYFVALGVVAVVTLGVTGAAVWLALRADRGARATLDEPELRHIRPVSLTGRLIDRFAPAAERTIVRLRRIVPWFDLRNHPWLSCAVVALAGAAGAFVFNESTAGGRFRDALIEAITIVAGFWLLAPMLGLRDGAARHTDRANVG